MSTTSARPVFNVNVISQRDMVRFFLPPAHLKPLENLFSWWFFTLKPGTWDKTGLKQTANPLQHSLHSFRKRAVCLHCLLNGSQSLQNISKQNRDTVIMGQDCWKWLIISMKNREFASYYGKEALLPLQAKKINVLLHPLHCGEANLRMRQQPAECWLNGRKQTSVKLLLTLWCAAGGLTNICRQFTNYYRNYYNIIIIVINELLA